LTLPIIPEFEPLLYKALEERIIELELYVKFNVVALCVICALLFIMIMKNLKGDIEKRPEICDMFNEPLCEFYRNKGRCAYGQTHDFICLVPTDLEVIESE